MLTDSSLRRRAPAVDFDHSPATRTASAAALRYAAAGDRDVWPIGWIRRFFERRSADVQCLYLRWQIANGKRHIALLKRSLKQTEHDVACLEVQLLVEEQRL